MHLAANVFQQLPRAAASRRQTGHRWRRLCRHTQTECDKLFDVHSWPDSARPRRALIIVPASRSRSRPGKPSSRPSTPSGAAALPRGPPRRLPGGACHSPPGDATFAPGNPPVRLTFLSLAFHAWAIAQITGTGGLQRVSRSAVDSYPITLPPFFTQCAIVEEIEAEQAVVATNRQMTSPFELKIHATLVCV
jgi:hypothetical protein